MKYLYYAINTIVVSFVCTWVLYLVLHHTTVRLYYLKYLIIIVLKSFNVDNNNIITDFDGKM